MPPRDPHLKSYYAAPRSSLKEYNSLSEDRGAAYASQEAIAAIATYFALSLLNYATSIRYNGRTWSWIDASVLDD